MTPDTLSAAIAFAFVRGSRTGGVPVRLPSAETAGEVANRLTITNTVRQADRRAARVVRFVFIIAVILSSAAFLLKLLEKGDSPLFSASMRISIRE